MHLNDLSKKKKEKRKGKKNPTKSHGQVVLPGSTQIHTQACAVNAHTYGAELSVLHFVD